MVHSALPKKLQRKVGRRTIIRRLADKGYSPERKINKSDPGVKLSKTRKSFGKKYRDWTTQQWKNSLQGVGDIKEFTWYPKELKPKFSQLRAPWTYMTKAEKRLPAFVRPKRWFPKKAYRKAKKQKVFSITTSNGQSLAFLVPKPWSTEVWAKEVKKRVAPFMKKAFPNLTSYTILLDGERLLHGPAAKAAFKSTNIKIFPNWPKYSPDLNPQENVWAWAEKDLRKRECRSDSFADFQKKVLVAVRAYPTSSKLKLVPSMAKRCALVVDKKGAMLKY